MRLYHVRVVPGSKDPVPTRTWLIIARSEQEARTLARKSPEVEAADTTIEAVRDLPTQRNRRQGIIGWMGDGPGAGY
jgi:hypothetical protein